MRLQMKKITLSLLVLCFCAALPAIIFPKINRQRTKDKDMHPEARYVNGTNKMSHFLFAYFNDNTTEGQQV